MVYLSIFLSSIFHYLTINSGAKVGIYRVNCCITGGSGSLADIRIPDKEDQENDRKDSKKLFSNYLSKSFIRVKTWYLSNYLSYISIYFLCN
jgi:hypothetical protein